MKQKAKRNPQDATLRNINALKKRVSLLETRLETLIYVLIEASDKRGFKKK